MIGAETQKSWIEYDKSNLSLLGDAASLRSFKVMDREEKSVVEEGAASVHVNIKDSILIMTTTVVTRVMAVRTCTPLSYAELSVPYVNITEIM